MAGLGIIIPRNTGGGEPVEVWSTYISDSFAGGSGTPNGRTLDNALGGTAVGSWAVTAAQSTQFGITGGVLGGGTADTSAALCIVAAPAGKYRASTKVSTLPASDVVGLTVRRTALSGGTDYRLRVASNGLLSGTGFTISGVTITAGSTIALGVDNPTAGVDRIRVWVNGALVLETTGTLNLASAGSAGFTRAAMNGAFGFDDFKLETAA